MTKHELTQEAKLRDNPLMRRFAESRRKMASDPYRPLYHFVSPLYSIGVQFY